MNPARDADLVVIGAGAKAVAIAAKVHVLNELGYGPLSVVIIERREVGASWTGRHGFTNGFEVLGTRPEKDVGFPYQSAGRFGAGGQRINEGMFRFSWQSHLLQIGEYRRWVDAGAQPPTHRELARYFSWVLSRATLGVQLRIASVTKLLLDVNGWRLECVTGADTRQSVVAQRGVVLTGPGALRSVPCAKDVAHRIIVPSMTLAEVEAIYLSSTARVCIVGSGESAVTMALWLLRKYGEDLELTFVAPSLPYSRAESFLENSIYSDAQIVDWEHLAEAQRREFIRRTDRGVMSQAALAQLARHRKLSFVVGRVRDIQLSRNGLARVLVDQPEEVVRQDFEAVAICTGSAPLVGLAQLLGDRRADVEGQLQCALSDEVSVTRQVDVTLALRGVRPRIHLPALAALVHGPGFANLSCLGSLTDCILSAHVGFPMVERENTVWASRPLLKPEAEVLR